MCVYMCLCVREIFGISFITVIIVVVHVNLLVCYGLCTIGVFKSSACSVSLFTSCLSSFSLF